MRKRSITMPAAELEGLPTDVGLSLSHLLHKAPADQRVIAVIPTSPGWKVSFPRIRQRAERVLDVIAWAVIEDNYSHLVRAIPLVGQNETVWGNHDLISPAGVRRGFEVRWAAPFVMITGEAAQ